MRNRKIILLFLTVLLSCALSACGKSTNNPEDFSEADFEKELEKVEKTDGAYLEEKADDLLGQDSSGGDIQATDTVSTEMEDEMVYDACEQIKTASICDGLYQYGDILLKAVDNDDKCDAWDFEGTCKYWKPVGELIESVQNVTEMDVKYVIDDETNNPDKDEYNPERLITGGEFGKIGIVLENRDETMLFVYYENKGEETISLKDCTGHIMFNASMQLCSDALGQSRKQKGAEYIHIFNDITPEDECFTYTSVKELVMNMIPTEKLYDENDENSVWESTYYVGEESTNNDGFYLEVSVPYGNYKEKYLFYFDSDTGDLTDVTLMSDQYAGNEIIEIVGNAYN